MVKMPVRMTGQRSGDASEDRVQKLEREAARLRAAVESLRGQLAGAGSRSAATGWLATAMAALALLLSLFSLLRH
jgi:hypothetical protein